jgi:hypothetical protein
MAIGNPVILLILPITPVFFWINYSRLLHLLAFPYEIAKKLLNNYESTYLKCKLLLERRIFIDIHVCIIISGNVKEQLQMIQEMCVRVSEMQKELKKKIKKKKNHLISPLET